jgi:hypothetical protein
MYRSACHRRHFGAQNTSLSTCWRAAITSIRWKSGGSSGNRSGGELQDDGRIRLWGYAASLGGYLRVVLLSDRETVHNAFLDEDYR